MAFKITGAKELERALGDLGSEIAGRLGTNAVRAGARVIANAAKLRAPVDTGELRRSIRVFDDRALNRLGGQERTAYAGTRVWYAIFPEFGTAHASPKSFLRPALDETAQQAIDKLTDNLGRGIERETAKYRKIR